MGNIKSLEVVRVTPQMAIKWLENTEFQRPLNQRHVDWLVEQRRAEKWRVNGESIVLCDNKVLDGQHRLWMVVETQMPTEMVVAIVRDPSVFSSINTGRTRSGADVLSIAAHNRSMASATRTAAASACKICMCIKDGRYNHAIAKSITNEMVTEFVQRHPVVITVTDQVRSLFGKGHGATISHIVTLVMQVSGGFPSVMSEFVEPIATGSMLVQHSAVWAFREKCKASPTPADFRTFSQRLSVLFRAWNYHVTGQTVKLLRSHAASEPFPTLIRKPGERVVNRKRA